VLETGKQARRRGLFGRRFLGHAERSPTRGRVERTEGSGPCKFLMSRDATRSHHDDTSMHGPFRYTFYQRAHREQEGPVKLWSPFSWQAKAAMWPWCQKVGGPFRNDDGRQRSGTDMDGQKGGHISLSRRREWRRVASAQAPRGESGSEAIEPITQGMDRDAAEFAEL